jgi:pimeloyl-ACP methyl ester carboxylesterase
VKNSTPEQFPLIDRTFAKFGVRIVHEGGWSRAEVDGPLHVREPFTRNILQKVEAAPWPYLPVDLLPIFVALGVRAEGSMMFWNKVYDGAMGWTSELSKFGAHAVMCDPHRVIIFGGKPLGPASVESPYIIRVAIALLMLASQHPGQQHHPQRHADPARAPALRREPVRARAGRATSSGPKAPERSPGVRLFVDIEGPAFVPDGPQLREKPTLILLHGGPGYDHSGFKPAFSRLADVAQVIYFDHRGHGRSSAAPADEWTLDTFADDVVRLCDALGIVKPIVLGQSFGGFVAQRYLARHPDHPARVVLSSTSPHLGLERKLAMFEQLGGPEARRVAEAFWTAPNADTWAVYNRVCMHLYNTQPARRRRRPRAHRLHDRDPVRLGRRRAADDEPAARPGRGALPGAGDGRRRRPGDADRGRRGDRRRAAAAVGAV